MKIKNLLLGAMLAIGCGVGFSASADYASLSQCCRTLQEECQLNYSVAACRNVYNNCMARRSCIIP